MDAMTQAVSSEPRLLVLDDDEQVGMTICAIARSSGFTTCATPVADEFFARLSSWQPTHLVVDLQMPGVDGIETLRQLASRNCNCSVIITSGLENRVLEAAARVASENGLRVLGILAKPFTPTVLRTLLQDTSDTIGSRANGDAAPTVRVSSNELMEMSSAINAQQFWPYYQPKVSCAKGTISGFECLARWLHPQKGLIMPDNFIPQAEKSGLIMPLSKQIFSRAFSWYVEHFQGSGLKIALNMSVRLLADAGFSGWLIAQCEKLGIHPSRIILEITETSSLANPVLMLEFLTQLRIKGFNLSIDDFGVGYSSLIQLARLPFSEMKIDKMFVMTAPQSQESQKIVAAIVGLARALGLSVTAEGVEDAWTLEMLREIGCDTAQGYHIARPLAPEAALDFARANMSSTASGG